MSIHHLSCRYDIEKKNRKKIFLVMITLRDLLSTTSVYNPVVLIVYHVVHTASLVLTDLMGRFAKLTLRRRGGVDKPRK